MTEKTPIAKINRSDFLDWRFSSDDDFDFFDDSSNVIDALQRQDNYQVNYNIDDILQHRLLALSSNTKLERHIQRTLLYRRRV